MENRPDNGKIKVVKHESQEELFFACASFIILLVVATADVLVRTW